MTSHSSEPAGETLTSLEEILDNLDGARLGRFHVRLLLIIGICWLFTSQGMSIIGYILPDLRQEWGLTSSQAGLVASCGVLGMMVGAILAGSLADRVGRRATLALVMVWLGSFSALSSLAGSYPILLLLRALTGIGLGAVFPVASTLVSEYSPTHYRGRLLVLLDGFSGLGISLSGLIGFTVVENLGWRPALLITSLAVVWAPLILFLLPESLRFLITQGRYREAQETGRRITLVQDMRAPVLPVKPAGLVVLPGRRTIGHPPANATPWSSAFLQITLSLWLLWFSINFTFQGILVWLPSLLLSEGNSSSQSSLFALVISLGQIPGTVIATLLADRISRRLILVAAMVLYGATVFVFGLSSSPSAILFWGCLLTICNAVTYGVAYPFTTELYPTRMRGAATGWLSGLGRIGGIFAPWAVGMLIQGGADKILIFSLLAAAPVITITVIAGLRKQTTGRALEEISA